MNRNEVIEYLSSLRERTKILRDQLHYTQNVINDAITLIRIGEDIDVALAQTTKRLRRLEDNIDAGRIH